MKILRAEMAQIPMLETGGEAAISQWEKVVNKIKTLVDGGADPRMFLTWQPVCRTMHTCGRAPHAVGKLRRLRATINYETLWKPVIQEDAAGHPSVFPEFENSSGTLVMHAYHLLQVAHHTGIRLWDLPYVFEFGGGYGSMARLMHKLGFDGEYTIYDMPIISALQRYFFRSLALPGCSPLCVSTHADTRSAISDYDKANGVFIGTMSFSEAPVDIREPIVEMFDGFGVIFVAYAEIFYGIDNDTYFKELMARMPHYQWEVWEMDDRPGKFYVVGLLKDEEEE